MPIITILLTLLLSFLVGIFARNILTNHKDIAIRNRGRKNINMRDRKIRLSIGILLFALGVVSGFLPFYFFSGFAFFEALISWCGFHALLGKNTCDIT